MLLLRSQRNFLFDTIVKMGFTPNGFTIEEAPTPPDYEDRVHTIVKFKSSPYYFTFADSYIEYSPALDKMEQFISTSEWVTKGVAFAEWISYLHRELSEPDKWAELYAAQEEVKLQITDATNTPFSYQEVIEIETGIQQLKTSLESIITIPEQLKIIHERLDYIQEKAKTFGRIDWKNLMVGTLLTTLMALALPPDTAKAVWGLIKEALQNVIILQLQ